MKIKHLLIAFYIIISALSYIFLFVAFTCNCKNTDWDVMLGLICFAICFSNAIPLLKGLEWLLINNDKKITK